MTSSPQSFNEHDALVCWELFGSPEKPRDIGSNLEDRHFANCTRISEGCEDQLDKGIVYRGGKWGDVSQISPQTSNELSILRKQGFLVCAEPSEEILIIELGPGDTTKTEQLLYKVSQINKIEIIRYIAVDFNRAILHNVQRLGLISAKIRLYCLWGSFDDAFKYIKDWKYASKKIYVWSFGSTISNDHQCVVSDRLAKWSRIGDLLIGQDSKQSREEMEAVYKSPAFTDLLNSGMKAANNLIGRDLFYETDKKTYEFSDSEVCISITRPERKPIVIFVAFKYDQDDMQDIAWKAGCAILTIGQEKSSRIYRIVAASPPATAE